MYMCSIKICLGQIVDGLLADLLSEVWKCIILLV